MLKLARGITFRMNIRSFLQLQGAFQRDGIVNIAPDINKVLVLAEGLRQAAARGIRSQDAADQFRQMLEFFDGGFRRLRFAAYLRKVCGEQKQRRELSGETLGRSNGNFV